MIHVIAEFIDALHGHHQSEAPLRNGPKRPHPAIKVDGVDRSGSIPLIIGRMPESTPLPDGMQVITETEHADRLKQIAATVDNTPDIWQIRAAMSVTRFQARAILRRMGLRDQVEAIMADPETDPLTIDAWNDAQEFRRLSPTIIALADRLKLTDEQVDDMFQQAAQIDA